MSYAAAELERHLIASLARNRYGRYALGLFLSIFMLLPAAAVPVLDDRDRLIAVLDVDSTRPAAFDEVDQRYLERAVALLRGRENLPVVAGHEQ